MTAENRPVEDVTTPVSESTPVAVVTGANSGIGLAAALELGRRGFHVVLLGRDAHRLELATAAVTAVAPVPAHSYRCDFNSFAAVRAVGQALRTRYPSIAVLANNAGGTVPERRSTQDGFEETIQSNHLSPFLLTHELLPSLRAFPGGGRIVNTSSRVHTSGRLDPDDLNSRRRSFLPLAIYASAKQANILFTVEATKRWPDLLSTALHPGVVRTRFGRERWFYRVFYTHNPLFKSPEQGAATLVHLAAASRTQLVPGAYYVDCKVAKAAPRATDPRLAERLWDASLQAVGLA